MLKPVHHSAGLLALQLELPVVGEAGVVEMLGELVQGAH